MLGEFCICSTNKVSGGSLYVLTYKIYEHTYRKWSFFNVCQCVHLKKSPFLATNTHKMVKHGPAKGNNLNTILYISYIGKSAIRAKKSQPKSPRPTPLDGCPHIGLG